MATIPADYPAEITGYVEPWIANPGDTVEVKASIEIGNINCQLLSPSSRSLVLSLSSLTAR
jgi:hypothetical protein